MNLKITLDQMKDLSIDEIIRLYQIGYRLDNILPENNPPNSDPIQSIKFGESENKLYNSDPIVDPYVNFGKVTVSTSYDNFVRSNIVIPRSKEVNVGPAEKQYRKYFHSVELRSFKDLQALRLIPEGLDEEIVRKAIAEDDAHALSEARIYMQTWMKKGQSEYPVKLDYHSKLRRFYNGIRKTQNPHLADVLSNHYGKKIDWDNILVSHVRWWSNRFWSNVRDEWLRHIIVLEPDDIVIQQNATMNLDASIRFLNANSIQIYEGGKMKINSSYIKINCRSIQGNIQEHLTSPIIKLNQNYQER